MHTDDVSKLFIKPLSGLSNRDALVGQHVSGTVCFDFADLGKHGSYLLMINEWQLASGCLMINK